MSFCLSVFLEESTCPSIHTPLSINQDIMSNLMVAPIEDNAALINAKRKPKTKSGWLDDLITEKAKRSLQLPTSMSASKTKGQMSKKPGMTKNTMVKMLEDEEDREAKVDYRKTIGDRHDQVSWFLVKHVNFTSRFAIILPLLILFLPLLS